MTSVDVPLKVESGADAGCSLPPELEREIFETAALRHPDLILTLLLVCHRVHLWVEPLLYRTLSFRNARVLLAAQNKSAEFLQNAVRHLFFDTSSNSSEDKEKDLDMLRKCTGATNIYVIGPSDPRLISILDKMRLQKLSFFFGNNPDHLLSTMQSPLFRSVTHLELYCQADARDPLPLVWQEWPHIASLPAVSHLCLSPRFHNDVLPHALAECPRISIVIAAFWFPSEQHAAIELAGGPTVRDDRCVVTVIPNYQTDWEIGARGGADFWERAEQFISCKRRGEIDTRVGVSFSRSLECNHFSGQWSLPINPVRGRVHRTLLESTAMDLDKP
ncbi:hypothetical protein DFH06DRAFT_1303319 [Mycena polygramma]|nr:hypothetical protein DFH06DRAFT_1303319 [Mycena polygramma]